MKDYVRPVSFERKKNGKKYECEFNRDAAVRINRMGFDITDIDTNAEEMIPLLFYGSLLMHQPDTTFAEALEIIGEWNGLPRAFVVKLGELYVLTRETICREEKDEDEKNGMWVVG